MTTRRSVVATFRHMSVLGEMYHVPLYIHRRLGDRDGWCVTIATLRRFFADDDSTVGQALNDAKVFLASVLRYELDVIRPYLPMVMHVVDTVNESGMGREKNTHTALVGFVNRFGTEQLVFVGTLKPLIDRHFECRYKIQELPSWLGHFSLDGACEAWLDDFKKLTSNLFYPEEFHDFVHETLQPLNPQLALCF